MQFEIDVSALENLRHRLEEAADRADEVLAHSVNRAADAVAVDLSRTLAEQVGLGVRRVRQDVQVTSRASPGNLEAEITVEGGATSLAEYAPRETRKGISAKPWGQRRVFPSTFFIPGRQEVFKRMGRERLPIERLHGPDLAREVGRGEAIPKARERAREVLQARILHELQRLMKK